MQLVKLEHSRNIFLFKFFDNFFIHTHDSRYRDGSLRQENVLFTEDVRKLTLCQRSLKKTGEIVNISNSNFMISESLHFLNAFCISTLL